MTIQPRSDRFAAVKRLCAWWERQPYVGPECAALTTAALDEIKQAEERLAELEKFVPASVIEIERELAEMREREAKWRALMRYAEAALADAEKATNPNARLYGYDVPKAAIAAIEEGKP